MIGAEEVKVCVLIPVCTDALSLMRNVELRLTNSNDRCVKKINSYFSFKNDIYREFNYNLMSLLVKLFVVF